MSVPTGATGPAAITAFGGLYSQESQIITVPGDGSAVVIELPDEMGAKDVALGTNTLTITEAGNYKIDISATMQSTTDSFGVFLSVRVNGAAILALSPAIAVTSAIEFISTSAIVALQDGDVLDLALSSATGGTILFGPGQNASLVAVRLGA